MDSEVARTLAELERKLQDLERALSSVGERGLSSAGHEYRGQQAGAYEPGRVPGSSSEPGGARLVDERLESASTVPAPPVAPPVAPPPPSPNAYGESPAFGAPAPAPRPEFDESIDLAELAHFRDRLEQTMSELLADYERIIRLRSVAERQGSATNP